MVTLVPDDGGTLPAGGHMVLVGSSSPHWVLRTLGGSAVLSPFTALVLYMHVTSKEHLSTEGRGPS